MKTVGKGVRVIGVYGEPGVAFIATPSLLQAVHFHQYSAPFVSLSPDGDRYDFVELTDKRSSPAPKRNAVHKGEGRRTGLSASSLVTERRSTPN